MLVGAAQQEPSAASFTSSPPSTQATSSASEPASPLAGKPPSPCVGAAASTALAMAPFRQLRGHGGPSAVGPQAAASASAKAGVTQSDGKMTRSPPPSGRSGPLDAQSVSAGIKARSSFMSTSSCHIGTYGAAAAASCRDRSTSAAAAAATGHGTWCTSASGLEWPISSEATYLILATSSMRTRRPRTRAASCGGGGAHSAAAAASSPTTTITGSASAGGATPSPAGAAASARCGSLTTGIGSTSAPDVA